MEPTNGNAKAWNLRAVANRFRSTHAEGIVRDSGERPAHQIRMHWWALVGPTLASSVVVMLILWVDTPRLSLVVLVTGWILVVRTRDEWSTIRTVIVAGLFLLLLVATGGLADLWIQALILGAVSAYLGHYYIEWWIERLVVSDRSLWKVSGLLVTHAPRVPLNRIYFQDVRQSIWEDVLNIGTLFFDTAASADDSIRRFGPVHEPLNVSRAIEEERSRYGRKPGPQPRPASPGWE